METDYREGGMMVEYHPQALPNEIQARVRRYAERVDLFSGCFDFIEDHRGEFYFLEINPEGVWGRHDEILNGAISSTMARCLIAEADNARE